jgi:glycine cleavage system aminomethyltransferase T
LQRRTYSGVHLRQLGLDWYLTKTTKAFGGKAAAQKASNSVPFSSEGISFMAKYKDWVSIKKLSIHEKQSLRK